MQFLKLEKVMKVSINAAQEAHSANQKKCKELFKKIKYDTATRESSYIDIDSLYQYMNNKITLKECEKRNQLRKSIILLAVENIDEDNVTCEEVYRLTKGKL